MRSRRALVVLVLVAAAAGACWVLLRRGFSARAEPTAAEEWIARNVRRLAVPRGAREARNPLPATPEVLAGARAHFADHCASCHANDGSGRTELGRSLYPKAPDMRNAATQDLTDGEIFYIIENGVRFTGMPAWGTESPEDDRATWELVHFIRRIPKLTPEEIEEMRAMNPKSRHELQEEEENRAFLEGEDLPEAPSPHEHRH